MNTDLFFNLIAPSEILPAELFTINNFEIEDDSIQKEEILEPKTELDLLPDRNDSVFLSDAVFPDGLVEHENKSGYSFLNEKRLEFDFKNYIKDIHNIEDKERHKYILSFPSKPELLRFKTFHMTIKLFNSIRTQSENVFVKLISDDFRFSNSFFQLSDKESEIKVIKINELNKSFKIRIKIYYENIVVEDEYFDLYKREKCARDS